jgi:hypothetical protein
MLLRIGGRLVSHFIELEAILDDYVDHTIDVDIQRGNSQMSVQLAVQDLHSVTPSEFVEFGDGIGTLRMKELAI